MGMIWKYITPMAWIHFCCTMLNVNSLKKGTTLTVLFPTQHAHTQGSLHYRLTTLGCKRYNAYSVDSHIP